MLWARYTVQCLLLMIFFVPSMRMRLVVTKRPITQLVRALLTLAVSFLILASLRVMPLAETTTIIYLSPLFVAVLAGPWLRERVGLGRWLAVLAGFTGALLIARPGGGLSLYGMLLALTAALCLAIYQILTRQISAVDNTATSLFYTALVGAVIMTAALPWLWTGPLPEPFEILLLVSLGVYAAVGHYLVISALAHAPASLLSPLFYVQLVWATLLGWQLFDHVPDLLSFVGMLIVSAGGLAVLLIERRRTANVRARLAAASSE
jgi:drug/metabolite transporter (DMT)-like permease